MNINWILRFKNKVTLITLIPMVVAFVYQVLSLFGVTPSLSQNTIIDTAFALVELLAMLGIVVDPTTAGIDDGELGMSYTEPKARS